MAQLGARLNGIEKVESSNLSGSTQKRTYELYLQDLHLIAVHRF